MWQVWHCSFMLRGRCDPVQCSFMIRSRCDLVKWPYWVQKSAPSHVRVENRIYSKLDVQGIKRSGMLRWSQKSRVWQKGKIILQKNWILRDLENFAKNCFSEKKSLGTSWRKSSTNFFNQRKILLLLIPFAPNFEEIFYQLL